MKNWKQLERHPLSAAYKDISGPAWKRFVGDLKKHGIVNGRCVTLLDGQVFDGWQLQRACIEADIEPEYRTLQLPEGMDPEEAVQIVNDNRRHESSKAIEVRVKKRRARVAAARRKGASTRAIAEAEGVSQQQVRRDLEASTETGVSVEPEAGKVTGRDGIERPATMPSAPTLRFCRDCRTGGAKPGCKMCELANKPAEREPGDDTESEAAANKRRQRNKSGELWEWKKFEEAIGILQREIVNAFKPYNAHNKPEALGLGQGLMEWRKRFKELHNRLKTQANHR